MLASLIKAERQIVEKLCILNRSQKNCSQEKLNRIYFHKNRNGDVTYKLEVLELLQQAGEASANCFCISWYTIILLRRVTILLFCFITH